MLEGHEITGLIGQGGFGVVYLARDVGTGRTVAIKEFLPSAIAARGADGRIVPRTTDLAKAYATGLKGFLREARMLSEFAHPALVAVHRVWEQNGTAYMAMQYYAGKTLRQLRAELGGSSSEEQIRAWLDPVFEAVAELHAHRVIHRDVSPDNILVMPDGATVLLDLGSARQVLGGMTQALTTVLKPGFAPIEQYVDDGSMEQGRWTDVYGLGAVIFFLASGRPPVAATTRIVRDSQPSLHEVAPAAGYSPALITAVGRALAVRAIDRFKSISEFRAALGWIKVARPPAAPQEVTQSVASRGPRRVAEGGAPGDSAPATPTAASPASDGDAAPIGAARAGARQRYDGSRGPRGVIIGVAVVVVLLLVVAVALSR